MIALFSETLIYHHVACIFGSLSGVKTMQKGKNQEYCELQKKPLHPLLHLILSK